MEDEGEVHLRRMTSLDPADVPPLGVVRTPQVNGVIARCQCEPIRLSEMQRLAGYRNALSQNGDLVL